MLIEIFKFELQYRIRRPDTYIYFLVIFISSLYAVNFIHEGLSKNINENAPFIIANTMIIMSAAFMMITSMIMGVAAMRDFDHQMEPLMFINPIKKSDYLMGRFLGSFVVLIFIFSGMLFGMMLSEFMPWKEAISLQPFNYWNYLYPFLSIVLPSVFFSGAIFFTSGAISRKLIVVYTQGVILLTCYLFAIISARGANDRFLSALLDPFSFETINSIVQFWTPVEKNILPITFEGVLLYNRLIWVGIGIVSLMTAHYFFKFTTNKKSIFRKTAKKTIDTKNIDSNDDIKVPAFLPQFGLRAKFIQLRYISIFYLKIILKEISFWAIVLCGIAIIFINSINLGTSYDVNSFPTTYLVIEELEENSVFFFLIILIFYSGELIWKEREIKINYIIDALPSSNLINLLGKYFGLIITYVILITILIISGVAFQVFNGYYIFEPSLYFIGFFGRIFLFLLMYSMVSFFIQAILNHKLIGHMLVVFFFVLTIAIESSGYSHGLYRFGGIDLQPYSDMNGYGHFMQPYLWFSFYWLTFCILLLIITHLFVVRNIEAVFRSRWKQFKLNLNSFTIIFFAIGSIILVSIGSYIFYNTNILNTFNSEHSQLEFRADYEKAFKKYEPKLLPEIVDVNLNLDLFPYQRNYEVQGYYILTNRHESVLNEIHIQKRTNEQINIQELSFEGGAKLKESHDLYGYYIYELNNSLRPGDSIKMEFKQTYTTQGFNHSNNTKVIYNGTFFNNSSFPTLGYNDDLELRDNDERNDFGLEDYKEKANTTDSTALYSGGMAGNDGEEINFEIIIGTHQDQIAIAPGYLQKKWTANNRNYFHYKMDKPIANFYSIVSADYEVKKDLYKPKIDSIKNDINLEIFYQKGHEYNLDRMMNGMKKSFAYYNENFSSYQYRQMRILEVPGYKDGAQSFPNTVPFSEKIGFILDIDDEEDVDIPFYVTAHELAHQWWGHFVNPADVKGKTMIVESLAQYSALMVLKKEYPDKSLQFIDKQTRDYLRGRAAEEKKENPLKSVERYQSYIHYAKGYVNFNTLQHYISEDSVNMALKRYIKDWNSFSGIKKLATGRFSTTHDLLGYLKEVTPDSLQYLVKDLFEEITTYDNRIEEVHLSEKIDQAYAVNLTLSIKKYQVGKNGIEEMIKNNDYIEIVFYGSNDEEIYKETLYSDESQQEISLILHEKPVYAILDPNHLLIEKDREDNKFSF